MSNILVTRSSMPSFEEYCEEIKEIWNSHWLTNMGVKHKELQKELENYLGISQCCSIHKRSFGIRKCNCCIESAKGR